MWPPALLYHHHLPTQGVLTCIGVWGWRPPFHTSPIVHKGLISSKRALKSVQKTPFWKKKMENFSLLIKLHFCPHLKSQAPKFENFSTQDLSIRDRNQFTSLTLWKSRSHNPTRKPVGCPSLPISLNCTYSNYFYGKFLMWWRSSTLWVWKKKIQDSLEHIFWYAVKLYRGMEEIAKFPQIL